MPQATRSCDHHTYRCYRRGPDGVGGLPPCGPGAPPKLERAPDRVNREHMGNRRVRRPVDPPVRTATSLSQPPGIGYIFNLGRAPLPRPNRNDIEAIYTARRSIRRVSKPAPSHVFDLATLFPCHGSQWMPEPVTSAPLHLDKRRDSTP